MGLLLCSNGGKTVKLPRCSAEGTGVVISPGLKRQIKLLADVDREAWGNFSGREEGSIPLVTRVIRDLDELLAHQDKATPPFTD